VAACLSGVKGRAEVEGVVRGGRVLIPKANVIDAEVVMSLGAVNPFGNVRRCLRCQHLGHRFQVGVAHGAALACAVGRRSQVGARY